MHAKDRYVALDTETTGLDPSKGDRVIEIGAVEVVGNVLTGNNYHQYISPMGRAVDPGAFEVHGISGQFLKDKPGFRMIVQSFRDYIGDSRLVIHNAKFDMGFLNAEFERLNLAPIQNEVCDSLFVARKLYPGQRNTLDALCSRLGVDNSGRDLHGALIDAALLADVFIKMTRLDQLQLGDDIYSASATADALQVTSVAIARRRRPPTLAAILPAAEAALHESFLEKKIKDSIWGKIMPTLLTA